jgi:succinoglycan biosynthesis protein ExoO
MPRVSVVIPAWQAAGFIGRAIASVRSQTMTDLEMVVVDDCSEDDTVDAALEAAAGDARLKIIRLEENSGPAVARNTGLAAARGEWVAVLDSDDAMEPWRLERLLRVTAARKADIVADNLRLVPESDVFSEGEPFLPLPETNETIEIDLELFADDNHLLSGARPLGYLKPMFRRAFLDGAGLRYDSSLRIGEDYQIVAAALAHGARYSLHPVLGYRYVTRAGSISRVMTARDAQALLAADDRFLSAYGGALSRRERAALRGRRASIADAAAFLGFVEALKRRDVVKAMRTAIARPAAMRLAHHPISARLRRSDAQEKAS